MTAVEPAKLAEADVTWVEIEPGVWQRTTAIDVDGATRFADERLQTLSSYWFDEPTAEDKLTAQDEPSTVEAEATTT